MIRRLVAVAGAALVLAHGAGAVEREPVLFEYQGRAYTAADIGPKLAAMLHAMQVRHHEEHAALLDEMVFEIHLASEAARTGEPRARVAERLLAVPEPTPDEVERFHADNRARIAQPLDAVRERIVRHLRAERLAAAKARLVAELEAEGGYVLARAPVPEPPIAFDLVGVPVRGRPDAPIAIVEFGDYQCPLCARAAGVMEEVLDRHPGEVRLHYLDFPVNRSGISRRVAEGAACADEQGMFWQYHDLAYERQTALGPDSPRSLAADLGLDARAFADCLASGRAADRVRHGERQARALGLGGTPAIFVNGRSLRSHDLRRDLLERVEALRRAPP